MTSASIEDMTAKQVRDAIRLIEHCYERGWTDGLPVVPPLEEVVREFIAYSGREPGEVIATVRHLDRTCTVELAAINAVMAGCRKE